MVPLDCPKNIKTYFDNIFIVIVICRFFTLDKNQSSKQIKFCLDKLWTTGGSNLDLWLDSPMSCRFDKYRNGLLKIDFASMMLDVVGNDYYQAKGRTLHIT